MNSVKVMIRDQYTLVLEEDAKSGDYIDLRNITKIDTSLIVDLINDEKNDEYQRMLKKELEKFAIEKDKEYNYKINDITLKNNITIKDKDNEINNLKIEIDKIRNESNSKIEITKQTILNNNIKELAEKDNIIDRLKDEIKSKDDFMAKEIELSLSKELEKYNKQINDLKLEINKLEADIKQKDLEKEAQENNIKQQLLTIESNHKLEISNIINEKDKEISNLKLQKSHKNVKLIGEELENWCNNEYQNYSICGFENCTWEKDNKAIKDETGVGTKADYIFKVYASNEYIDDNLLTSVTCEMKNEDPTSKNKKKNEDHYKKLDQDRKKKNCEYALLISELEWNTDNDAPIRKVNEYDKMYMVRPQYFITFLSIIESLGKKYQNLILAKEEEKKMFKESTEIIDEFDKFKDTLINKFIERINKEVGEINKQANSIKDSADKILASTSKVVDNYLSDSKRKIENFDITKIIKKINKIS